MFKSNNQLTPGYTLSSITPSGGLIVGKDFKFSTGTLDPHCRGMSVPSRVSNRLLAMHGHNRPTSVQFYTHRSVVLVLSSMSLVTHTQIRDQYTVRK